MNISVILMAVSACFMFSKHFYAAIYFAIGLYCCYLINFGRHGVLKQSTLPVDDDYTAESGHDIGSS